MNRAYSGIRGSFSMHAALNQSIFLVDCAASTAVGKSARSSFLDQAPCEGGGGFLLDAESRREEARVTSRGAHAGLRCFSISSGRELTADAAATSRRSRSAAKAARSRARRGARSRCWRAAPEYRQLAHAGVRAGRLPDSPRLVGIPFLRRRGRAPLDV